MKPIVAVCVASPLIAMLTCSAAAAPTCLKTYLIRNTKVIDENTLDFTMVDGETYRNNLLSRCVGLKFHGFVYATRIDEICDDLQSIRVLETGAVCRLGAFSKVEPAPAPPK